MLGFWFSIYGLFFGTVCSLKAKSKNRSSKDWFLLGFIFGVFAYLILSVLPDTNTKGEFAGYDISYLGKTTISG